MTKRVTMLLIVLIALLPFWGVQAGKPKPTPYPEPDVQIHVYPSPEPTEPPFELPQGETGAGGYIWGLFPDGDGYLRWWASKPGIWFGSDVSMCVISRTNRVICFDMLVYQYDGTNTWYHSVPFVACGWWSVEYGWWDGEIMEIRQPNDYRINCVHFPGVRRG